MIIPQKVENMKEADLKRPGFVRLWEIVGHGTLHHIPPWMMFLSEIGTFHGLSIAIFYAPKVHGWHKWMWGWNLLEDPWGSWTSETLTNYVGAGAPGGFDPHKSPGPLIFSGGSAERKISKMRHTCSRRRCRGTQSISPLLWSIQSGSLEAGQEKPESMLRDQNDTSAGGTTEIWFLKI